MLRLLLLARATLRAIRRAFLVSMTFIKVEDGT